MYSSKRGILKKFTGDQQNTFCRIHKKNVTIRLPNSLLLVGCGGSNVLSEVFGNNVPKLEFIDIEEKFQMYNVHCCALRPILANKCESRWSGIDTGFRQQ